MNCGQAKQTLWDYYDEACSPAQRRELEEHLSRCRECRASLDEWIALSQTAFRMQPAKAPAFLWTRVLARIEEQEQQQTATWWYQLRWMSRIATAMALLVSLGAGCIFFQAHQGTPLEDMLQGGENPPQMVHLSSARTPAKSDEITVAWLLGGSSWDPK